MIPDGWLSAVCGHPCFRVSESAAAHPEAVPGQLLSAAKGSEAFFYLRIPVENVRVVTGLVRHGFNVVETALTLEYQDDKASPPIRSTTGIEVSTAKPDQVAAATDIASRNFRYSRFHLDPLFPLEMANRIKRAWIESYGRGARGVALYTAGRRGIVEGFLAALLTDGGRTAVIDLNGVDERSARQGIGLVLVQHFIDRWKDATNCLRVGTQAVNIPSLRLYESCGFRMTRAAHALHAHVRNGMIVS